LDTIPVFSQRDVQEIKKEASVSLKLSGLNRFKTQLLLPVLDKLVRNVAILQVVCDVLQSANILVWSLELVH
jgi:hypothetical protein